MERKLIIGTKYFIKDLILDDIIEIQITQFDNITLSYKNLNSNKDIEIHRKIDEIELIIMINNEDDKRLNFQGIYSVQTDLIKAIISRNEMIQYSKNDFNDLNINKDTVLISITDPDKSFLNQNILKMFKDVLSIQFWDIEQQIGDYKPINEKQSKIINHFIQKHKKDNFIIHCEAGISRSAGVGLAIECIVLYNSDKYIHMTSESKIKEHLRYHPNLFVYDQIIGINYPT